MKKLKVFAVACLCLAAVLPATSDNLIIGSAPTDPARSTFEKHNDSGALLLTGNLSIPRAQHTATLLKNSSIFVAGGTDDTTSWQILNENGTVLNSGLLRDGRFGHTATLLTNGNVFIAGGNPSPGTWEIRSPTGSLVASGALNGSRTMGVSAVTLHNGNIWISGSSFGNGDACTWEIHNSGGALVSSGSLNSCFAGAQVQVVSTGNVILFGGDNNPSTYEIRNQAGAFVATGDLLNTFNSGASSVVLNNGDVFIFGSCSTGGCNNTGSPGTWEIRNATGGFVSTGSLQDTRDTAGTALLSNGNIFISGGNSSPGSWEIRNSAGAFVASGSLFDTRKGGQTLTHF